MCRAQLDARRRGRGGREAWLDAIIAGRDDLNYGPRTVNSVIPIVLENMR